MSTLTDRELELLYMHGCSQSQAAGLRAVFDAGVQSATAPAPEIVPPAPAEKPKPAAKKTTKAKQTKRGRK